MLSLAHRKNYVVMLLYVSWGIVILSLIECKLNQTLSYPPTPSPKDGGGVALITGGSSGIGRAVGVEMVRGGGYKEVILVGKFKIRKMGKLIYDLLSCLIWVGRSEKKLKESEDEILDIDPLVKVTTISLDLSTPSNNQILFDQVVEKKVRFEI